MSETGYLFKAEHRAEPGKPVHDRQLNAECRKRMPLGRGPWRFRILRDGKVTEDWDPRFHRHFAAARRWAWLLRHSHLGDVIQVESRKGKRYRCRSVKLPEKLDGVRVMAAIRAMWGAPYVFGAENPPGDPGGPGAAFDCSGLVDWAHNTVGVDLPHSSEAIRVDPRVVNFTDEGKCKEGDLVIMHLGRLPVGVADHIGCWRSKGVMWDTRNPLDPVSASPIESWGVMSFGRIVAVNGPLE